MASSPITNLLEEALRVLKATKLDAEKNGFKYGKQAVVVKTIRSIERYIAYGSSNNSSELEALERQAQRLTIENKAFRAAFKACDDIAKQNASDSRMMNMWHVINNTLRVFP